MSEPKPVDLGEVVMTPVLGETEPKIDSEPATVKSKRGRPSNAEKAARAAATVGADESPQIIEEIAPVPPETPAVPQNVEEPDTPTVGVFAMNASAQIPEPATLFSAGADVRANFEGLSEIQVFTAANKPTASGIRENFGERSIVLQPGARAKIPTGLIFDIPVGWKIAMHPRSGLSLKQGLNLANCVAVVDYDYTEELFILVANNSQLRLEIKHGDRIAQMSLEKVHGYKVKQLTSPPGQKSERDGGIGSTGVQ